MAREIVDWVEEILIRGRPDGSYAVSQKNATAIKDGDNIGSISFDIVHIELDKLADILPDKAELMHAQSLANERADKAEAALKELQADIDSLRAGIAARRAKELKSSEKE